MIHSFDQALDVVLQNAPPLPPQWVALDDLVGRVVAEDISAPYDLPCWDNSEMDGFAVRAADCRPFARLTVSGFIPAGASAEGLSVEQGTAIRIMTGAPIPAGADAVVPIEQVTDEKNSVIISKQVDRGDYIRFRGSDISSGEVMICAGQVLRPADINLLASFSLSGAKVHSRPRVAILSTGDELVPVGEQPGRGQLIDSNSHSLAAAVREIGATPIMLGIARDTLESLRDRLSAGLQADVLITSAGVSTGDRDLVREVLAASGVRQLFWRINIKPGGPTAFATLGKRLIFSLPGNPVSSMIAFDQLVRPALLALMGFQASTRPPIRVRLLAPLVNETRKLRFLRVRVSESAEGYWAESAGDQNTGIVSTMIRANGIAILPPDCPRRDKGEWVDVQLLEPLVRDQAGCARGSASALPTVKALSFIARSGTGKTTLLERVIGELSRRGYRVGSVKTVSHHFEVDRSGKDSFRLAQAGSIATMICAPDKLALIKNLSSACDISGLLASYFYDCDIVLIEGDKEGPLPKIEVFRSGCSDSLLCAERSAANCIAVASDCPLDIHLPLLDLNSPVRVADFIVSEVLSR